MLLDFLNNKILKIVLIFSLVWTFLDVILDLFLSLLHPLAILVHYAFEFYEHSLDLMVEHLFHTGPRETQIIVFYIMVASGCVIAYLILRKLPGWYCSFCEQVRRYWYQETAKAKIFWESQLRALKAKWYVN